LEGHHHCVRANQGWHSLGCFSYLPGFNPYQHSLNRANFSRIISSLHRLDQKIAAQAVNPKAVLPHRLQMGATSNKYHFFAGLGQPRAKIAPDPAGPKNCNPHDNSIQPSPQ
jgi:hypothetical protein